MTTAQMNGKHVDEWPLCCNESSRTMAVDLTKPGMIAVDAFNRETGETKQYILKITRRGIALL